MAVLPTRVLPLATAILAFAGGAAHADVLTNPGMNGPLAANPNPKAFIAGPFGQVYLTGAASALAYRQDNVSPGDNSARADFSNAQVFLQTTEGWLRFFVQAGAYSLPSLGTAYETAANTRGDTYGFVPQAYVTLAPTDNFSISAGKMPTLVGAEDVFTFENMNIESGLLSNQQNGITRGLQANFTAGPLSFALAWNDGYYSNRFSWFWGSLSYAIDNANSLTLAGGRNLADTRHSDAATPLLQDNGEIYNLIYARSAAPWTFNAALQFSHVPKSDLLGIAHGASTFGAALWASYAFDDRWNLSARAEYIDTTGWHTAGAPNLLYGKGSNAWSITLTPSYQHNIFFARAEASYVGVGNAAPGAVFGPTGNNRSQARAMFETGVLF